MISFPAMLGAQDRISTKPMFEIKSVYFLFCWKSAFLSSVGTGNVRWNTILEWKPLEDWVQVVFMCA